jgi:hypothetical protein
LAIMMVWKMVLWHGREVWFSGRWLWCARLKKRQQ